MKVHDPGHIYELENLDDTGGKFPKVVLCFVKREGEGYPGNVGHHPGTNLQEVLRALIDRVEYLNSQIYDDSNLLVVNDLRNALWNLESRAALRHGRTLDIGIREIESHPVCTKCGHIGCRGSCDHARR